MYKVIGADGKEYGPVSLEQLRQWAVSGRVNAQTRIQPEGATDWKPAADFPEVQAMLASARPPVSLPPHPGAGSALNAAPPQTGLAVTSLVLGIFSLICFGLLAGIPAIVCGHKALKRARTMPQQHGGAGMALAGLIMGYASIFLTIVLVAIYAAMLLPALAKAKSKTGRVQCTNNLKQIGLSFKVWALDNNDQFPFNVSTNQGGTLELCQPSPDGFDLNGAYHLLVMSNELSTPKILICPTDSKPPLLTWQDVRPGAVSYKVRSGESVNDANPQEVLAVCPIHGNVLRSDGSVMYEPEQADH